jgi:hypothetical protein
VEAGFDSDIGGDVPDRDNTENRESDEDAAWRELVARFEEPATTTEPVPWPERENVASPRPQAAQEAEGTDGASGVYGVDGVRGTPNAQGVLGAGESQDAGGAPGSEGRSEGGSTREARGTRADGDLDEPEETHGDLVPPGAHGEPVPPGTQGALDARGARGVDGIRGFDDEGVREAFDGDGRAGTHEPDVIQAAGRDRRTAAHGTRARRIRARKVPPRPGPEDEEEHFTPPAPPPLPKLDPIAKGAWAALFGGPGYLVVATAVGWSVSGIAAFCAVAAFVTGFAILVLRMNEPPGPGPDGPDDGDDGAIV